MDIYKEFIKTYGIYILVISVVGGTLGFVSTRFLPERYDVSLSLSIDREDDTSELYYSYDGFYSLQAEEQFSKTVSTWFSSPDFVETVLKSSGKESLQVEDLSVTDFRQIFSAEQISATGVEVSFGVEDQSQGEVLTEAIDTAILSRLTTQKQDEYRIFVGEPVIRTTQHNPVLWGFGGFVFGLALAIGSFAIREYLK